MNNYAIIDYNQKKLTLFFRWQTFTFDLDQGDIGEFWYGFETHDLQVYDVNYGEEEDECNPSVLVYATTLDEDGELTIDSWNYFEISIKELIGQRENYFSSTLNAQ